MTKRPLLVFAIGLVSLCGATAASAQPQWGNQRTPQNGACFFEDRNFGGRSFCVRPGDDLRSLPNGMNDRISSMRLLGGSDVTVFKDSDMRGQSARFTGDVNDLRRDGWNDRISSIVVAGYGAYGSNNGRARGRGRGYDNGAYDNGAYDSRSYDDRGYNGWNPNTAPVWGRTAIPREGACFYEDVNYRGQYFCVPRGGSYTSLPSGFNDRISSVRVFGSSVQIYRERNYRGRSTEIRRDAGDLRGDWRDTVSSIRVF